MDPREPVPLLEELVQIPSHESVHEVREYLTDVVDEARVHPESGCVVATKGSQNGGPNVLLNSHMDVVPPHLPFERDDDVIRGRGSCDAKGSLVPLISAFSRVAPESGQVTLVVSPDEETYSEGLYDYLALEGDRFDMAINGEPTGLDVCNAARGSLKYIVDFEGVGAHAGTSESGRSAVSCAAEAVRRLEDMEQLEHEYLGTSNQTVSWIQGGPVGELTSQVPREVSMFINRWSVPPESPEDFKHTLEEMLADLACDVTVRYPYQPNRFLEAHQVDPDETVIQDMADAVEGTTGSRPDVRPFAVAAESAFLSRYMPTAIFGPGLSADDEGPIAHSDREYVPVDEVDTAADIVTSFLEDTV